MVWNWKRRTCDDTLQFSQTDLVSGTFWMPVFPIFISYLFTDIFSQRNLLHQAMVVGMFGCLLLLVGTCSAWHDSYHGELLHHAKSFLTTLVWPLSLLLKTWPQNGRTIWTVSRQSCTIQGTWIWDQNEGKTIKERSQERAGPSFNSFSFQFQTKQLKMRSQGGARPPVPTSLCKAEAICTEPGTPWILQVCLHSCFCCCCCFLFCFAKAICMLFCRERPKNK